MLAALEAVDLVVLFEEDTPLNLITRIKPGVLVKGGDYTREQVVGHEIVEAHGGEVRLVEILQGFSTTSLVERARGGQGVSTAGRRHRRGRALPAWRDPAAWMTTADIFAVLVAAALPWSTSLVGIFAVALRRHDGCRPSICGPSCSR